MSEKELSESLKKNLNNKLEILINHYSSLKEEKKVSNASFNEQIKEVEKKFKCIASCLKYNDDTHLFDAFNQYEIEDFGK